MIKWLKGFWNSTGEKYFFPKFLAPILGLFFTWGFLGHIYTANLELSDLTPNSGTITFIDIVHETGGRGNNYYPLKIRLDTNPDEYRLVDRFELRFPEIMKHLAVGDRVTLYTRSKLQTLIGMKRKTDIYQIEMDGKVLFPLNAMLFYTTRQKTAFGMFGFVCWTVFIFYKIPRLRRLFATDEETEIKNTAANKR